MDKLFPRDLYGRIALGLSSSVLGPFFVWMFGSILYAELFGPGRNWLGRVTLALVGELALALALFFACSLLWAIAIPQWLEGARKAVTKRIAIATIVAMLSIAILLISAL